MELLIGVVLALIAWMLWNGLKPPGATVKSSLERERRRRKRGSGDGGALRLVLLTLPIAGATLLDCHAVAATLIG
jgi:hypothetical protein